MEVKEKKMNRKELEDKIMTLEKALQEKEELLNKIVDARYLINERITAETERIHEVFITMKNYVVGDKVNFIFLKDLCKTFIDAIDNRHNLENMKRGWDNKPWR